MAWTRILVCLLVSSVFSYVDCANETERTCQHNGEEYMPGQLFKTETCRVCECDNAGSGNYACATMDCWEPPCSDPVTVSGLCCPLCPDGLNCKAYDGTVIKEGENVTLDDGVSCVCVEGNSWSSLEAQCTVRPRKGCTDKGKTYAHGDTFIAGSDPCEKYECYDGELLFFYEDCPGARCWDAMRHPGECCYVCPNGENCKYGNTIIKAGEIAYPDGVMCSCETHWEDIYGMNLPLYVVCTFPPSLQ